MKKGQKIKVFDHWQTLQGNYYEGELLKKISDGLPFILVETSAKTYSWQSWLVRNIENNTTRVVKLRTMLRKVPREPLSPQPIPTIKDTFLKVGNKEIF